MKLATLRSVFYLQESFQSSSNEKLNDACTIDRGFYRRCCLERLIYRSVREKGQKTRVPWYRERVIEEQKREPCPVKLETPRKVSDVATSLS